MKLHEINGYIQSIYVAEYKDKLLLLDGACRADVDTICEFISGQLKRPLTDLKLIVCTHMHPDHAGAAEKLKQIIGCDIAMTKTNKHWYRGLDGFLMFLTDMALAKWVAKRKKKASKWLWYNRHLQPDLELEDGQMLPGFEDWQALYTQGHTDRCLSLYHADSSQVYVADLIVIVKKRFIPPFPVFHPNRYKQSIKRIKELSAQTVILAHGGKIPYVDIDFEYIENKAPHKPTTHMRSAFKKLQTAWGRS
ncbi:MAG: MBL fold metallo-hydrolase [Gammaproteobacteria bacterium]|nr:MBL fold metallo-hydrolase [Gammaproteobacteria bacterium]